MLRRLAICSAFATWCFADTWVEYAEGDTAYFSRLDPFRTVVVPVAILEIVLILGMLAVWEFCRERRLTQTPALHYLFLFSCLAPLGIASVAALRIAPTHVETAVRLPWFWPAVLLVSSIPAGWACLRPLRASRLLRNTLFYSCPVLLFTLLQAARGTLHYPHAAYADGAPGVAIPASHPDTRVVWIIFDELSQTIAFANRPPNLALPNLDRLRPESFYATAAAPPADSTEISLPGLVLGEPVVGASPRVRPTSNSGSLRAPGRLPGAPCPTSSTAPVSWASPPPWWDGFIPMAGCSTAA